MVQEREQEVHGRQARLRTVNSKKSRKPRSEILRNEVGDASWTMGRTLDFILNMMGVQWSIKEIHEEVCV